MAKVIWYDISVALWWSVQGLPRLSPNGSWDRLQPPHNWMGLSGYWKWKDGWFGVTQLCCIVSPESGCRSYVAFTATMEIKSLKQSSGEANITTVAVNIHERKMERITFISGKILDVFSYLGWQSVTWVCFCLLRPEIVGELPHLDRRSLKSCYHVP